MYILLIVFFHVLLLFLFTVIHMVVLVNLHAWANNMHNEFEWRTPHIYMYIPQLRRKGNRLINSKKKNKRKALRVISVMSNFGTLRILICIMWIEIRLMPGNFCWCIWIIKRRFEGKKIPSSSATVFFYTKPKINWIVYVFFLCAHFSARCLF